MGKSLLFIVVPCVLGCGRVNYDLLAPEDGQTTTAQDGAVGMGDSSPGSTADADLQLRTCRDNTTFDCFGQSLSIVSGGSIQAFGRLEEFSNVHTPSCGAGSGEYRVEFENINGPITARFRVDAAFDTLIYALSDGCGGQELACENNNGSNEELIINLAAGQEVLIVVEGLYECGSLTVIQDTP